MTIVILSVLAGMLVMAGVAMGIAAVLTLLVKEGAKRGAIIAN